MRFRAPGSKLPLIRGPSRGRALGSKSSSNRPAPRRMTRVLKTDCGRIGDGEIDDAPRRRGDPRERASVLRREPPLCASGEHVARASRPARTQSAGKSRPGCMSRSMVGCRWDPRYLAARPRRHARATRATPLRRPSLVWNLEAKRCPPSTSASASRRPKLACTGCAPRALRRFRVRWRWCRWSCGDRRWSGWWRASCAPPVPGAPAVADRARGQLRDGTDQREHPPPDWRPVRRTAPATRRSLTSSRVSAAGFESRVKFGTGTPLSPRTGAEPDLPREDERRLVDRGPRLPFFAVSFPLHSYPLF
jgi:hypothetical protein